MSTNTRTITAEETALAQALLGRARAAMDEAADYGQADVDRLCQAVASGHREHGHRGAALNMSVDESGMGGREPSRRGKVLGILRDALRQKSIGDDRGGAGQRASSRLRNRPASSPPSSR